MLLQSPCLALIFFQTKLSFRVEALMAYITPMGGSDAPLLIWLDWKELWCLAVIDDLLSFIIASCFCLTNHVLPNIFLTDCLMHTLQQLDTPLPMSKDKPNLSMDPMLDNVDAILFFTGTLKFLAASPVVSDTLYNHPAFVIGLLSLHQQVDRRIRLGSKKSPTEPIAKFELEDLEERLYLILVQVRH